MVMKNDISADYVRQCLNYDQNTGILTWKNRDLSMFNPTEKWSAERRRNKWNSQFAGKVAGGLRSGYLRIRLDGVKYTAAHIIWFMTHGQWPANQIDHKDGVRSRNILDNLREATNAENCQNRKKRKTNKSGYTGVHEEGNSGKWKSEIQVKKERIYLGTFNTKEEARNAYLAAKSMHHKFQPIPRAEA